MPIVWRSGSLNLLESYELVQGMLYLLLILIQPSSALQLYSLFICTESEEHVAKL